MEHRVPFSTREVAGATLVRSTTGGYSVLVGDAYLGFMHAAQGARFNTYRRVIDGPDAWLGKHAEEDAVRAILDACGLLAAPAEVA